MAKVYGNKPDCEKLSRIQNGGKKENAREKEKNHKL